MHGETLKLKSLT